MNNHIGIVIIGRNEGDRLIHCFNSVLQQLPPGAAVVYVDSGSTDGSPEAAKALGIAVVHLDMSRPFTMARGRNTGFNYLVNRFQHLKYVQFIDGDCELQPDWLNSAQAELDQQENLAIVCGRLRERFPHATAYNRLADIEWDTPVGEAQACGGIAMMRVSALQAVNGFNIALICGEEPEMCIRLRQQGWKIRRIAAEMALHDIAMTQFRQWWIRSIRGGWAIAEGVAMYGKTPERYMLREHRSGWLWGVLIPCLGLGLGLVTAGFSLLLLLSYVYLMLRIYQYRLAQGDQPAHARLYAFFCVLSKLPQSWGQLKYWLNRWRGQPARLIEYKTSQYKVSGFAAPVLETSLN